MASKYKRKNTLLRRKLREMRSQTNVNVSVNFHQTPNGALSTDHQFANGMEVLNDADRSVNRLIRPRYKIREEQHG